MGQFPRQVNDSSNAKSNGRGGVRAGAGRKNGSLEPQTIERAAVLKAFRERVARHADDLFDFQFTLARGCTVLYRAATCTLIWEEPR